MDENQKTNGRSDHDILIKLETQLDISLKNIADLSRTITENTASLRESKLDKDTFTRWEREFDKDITEMKAQVFKSIEDMKKSACDGLGDHNKRIRVLEKWGWMAIGGLALLQLIIALK